MKKGNPQSSILIQKQQIQGSSLGKHVTAHSYVRKT